MKIVVEKPSQTEIDQIIDDIVKHYDLETEGEISDEDAEKIIAELRGTIVAKSIKKVEIDE